MFTDYATCFFLQSDILVHIALQLMSFYHTRVIEPILTNTGKMVALNWFLEKYYLLDKDLNWIGFGMTTVL